MMRTNSGENMTSKKVHQPFDDTTTIDSAGGSEGTRVTIERIKKMGKILALINSPHEGEALAAARMAMKLVQAWGIDLPTLRFSSGDLVDNLLEKVAESGSSHFFSSYTVQKHHVSECSDPEIRRRTTPTFVKAHSRRRRGGPPFPVRPHRRRRRARASSSARGGWVRRENPAQFLR
jgi:hypothetical protein